jgi:hypothetical protein
MRKLVSGVLSLSAAMVLFLSLRSPVAAADDFSIGGIGDDGDGSIGHLDVVPIYRFIIPGRQQGHLMTLDSQEGLSARLRYEGVAFGVFNAYAPGLTPLFRCRAGNDHFVSVHQNCEGTANEGLLGFVFSMATSGTSGAIYRCFRNGDHLSTVNPSECSRAGYRIEGVQGYAPELN